MTTREQASAKPLKSLVSVTSFRLRSIRFDPFFILHASRTIAQIRKVDGFVAGAVAHDADLAFWTMTVWRNGHVMRAYTGSGARWKAIPHVLDWANAASVGHWAQLGSNLPAWPEAVRRLREEGRPLTLRHPAANHTEQQFAEAKMTYGVRLRLAFNEEVAWRSSLCRLTPTAAFLSRR